MAGLGKSGIVVVFRTCSADVCTQKTTASHPFKSGSLKTGNHVGIRLNIQEEYPEKVTVKESSRQIREDGVTAARPLLKLNNTSESSSRQ